MKRIYRGIMLLAVIAMLVTEWAVATGGRSTSEQKRAEVSAAAEDKATSAMPGAGAENAADGAAEEKTEPTPEPTPKPDYAFANAHLRISEVMAKNHGSLVTPNGEEPDWIELENTAGEAIALNGYTLSDGKGKFTFAASEVPANGYLVIYAGAEEGFTTPFSLNADETLTLYDPEGVTVSQVKDLHTGADEACALNENGEYVFTDVPTPGSENATEGRLPVAETPEASVKSLAADAQAFTVELSAAPGAEIYYTSDGSLPDEANGALYTEPIRIENNTILRAVARMEGCEPSRVATYSYLTDADHDMPVISLVADRYGDFSNIYWSKWKNTETAGHMELIDGGETVFSAACGIQLKGWTSRELPKKSLGIYFRGKYGDGSIKCDLFGNGKKKYSSLSVRAGQDYTAAVVRNELMQALCAESCPDLVTQNGRYCALYINGSYWGLYCLKENINEHFIADVTGADKDGIEIITGQTEADTDLYEALSFTWNNDMADGENYHRFTERFNVDSLIDWIILEGYSANSDTLGNIKYFRAPDYDGNRYNLIFYDLDWSLRYRMNCYDNIFNMAGNAGDQMWRTANALIKNADFRDKFLTRFAELIGTTLSNAHVLERFDQLAASVENEVVNDHAKWDMSLDDFYAYRENLHEFITDYDYADYCTGRICHFFALTNEEEMRYFGRDNIVIRSEDPDENTD